MNWTSELIDELTKLWHQGLSASAIGKRLGVSKNAIVGKAHRLKLPARPSPIRRRAHPLPSPAPSRIAPPMTAAELPAPTPAPEPLPSVPPLGALRGAPRTPACQWPIGDPMKADFRFCDAPAMPGKPYCSQHCAVAYVGKSRSDDTEAA